MSDLKRFSHWSGCVVFGACGVCVACVHRVCCAVLRKKLRNAHAHVEAWDSNAHAHVGARESNALAHVEAREDNAHARVQRAPTGAQQCPCSRRGAGSNGAPFEGRSPTPMPMLVSPLHHGLLAARGANLTLPTEGRTGHSGRSWEFREPKR